MRYVGYALLFILFFYFVFLKPYLILHKVEIRLDGLEINLKERSLKFKEALIVLPSYFIRLEGATFYKNHLRVREVSVITVSFKVSEEPFEYDLANLTRVLGRFNISLERAYVSVNSVPSAESITAFLERIHLNNKKMLSEKPAIFYHIKKDGSHKIEVLVKEAYLEGPTFHLVSSEVVGENYRFDLRGSWRGKRGSFNAMGFVSVLGSYIKTKADGYIDYTTIRADLQLQTDELRLMDRVYRNLKGVGKYTYVRRKQNVLYSSLDGDGVRGRLEYDVGKEAIRLSLDQLSVDEGLLRVKQKVKGVFSGNLSVNLRQKRLSLEGAFYDLLLDRTSLGSAKLRLVLAYDKKEGEVDFSSEMLEVRGRFHERDFKGRCRVKGFSYSTHWASGLVFYEGDLSYLNGNLESSGDGSVSDLSLYGRKLGEVKFSLSFKNPNFQVVGEGKGFKLKGSGSVAEKVFAGDIDLVGFSFKEGDWEASEMHGRVSLQTREDTASLSGRVQGVIKREGLTLRTLSKFYLSRLNGRLGGEFTSELEHLRYGGLEFKKGFLKGGVQNEEINFGYNLEERLRGMGKLQLKDLSFSTQGEWSDDRGEFSYRLKRAADGIIAGEVKGRAKLMGFSIPVDAHLQVKKDSIRATLKGFKAQRGTLAVDVEKVDVEDGKINFGGARVRLNAEEVIRVYPAKGPFDLRTRRFELADININGYAQGQAKVSYNTSSGLRLFSEGHLDLAKASKLIRSRTQTVVVGNLYYYLSTDGKRLDMALLSKERIELRSRYLGSPLWGSAYFFGDGRVFKGSANFVGNGSSFKMEAEGTEKKLLVHFDLDKVPLIYQDNNLRGNVFLKGGGSMTTDYKRFKLASELSLGGTIDIKSFSRKGGQDRKGFYERVDLDLRLSSYEPLRVYLPEGYVYTSVDGYLKGALSDPDYRVKLSFSGGELRYFNRKFYVKSGTYEVGARDKEINLSITSSSPEYVVFIDLRGSPESPKVLLRSEPPREPRQIITELISAGGRAEGLIHLGDILASHIPQMTALTKGLERTLGTEVSISVSPHLGSSGEVGISTKISKDITDRLSVEYQQSSLKDPRESYVGGNARILSGFSVGGRINSDGSREIKLRMRGKFNF